MNDQVVPNDGQSAVTPNGGPRTPQDLGYVSYPSPGTQTFTARVVKMLGLIMDSFSNLRGLIRA